MPSQVETGNPSQDNNNEDSKSKTIKVHIAIFFDGTGNSMMNVKERKAYDAQSKKVAHRDEYYKKNDSHLNDLSNVAKLYTMYQTKMDKGDYDISIYIEGIGTAPRPVAEITYNSQYFASQGIYDDSTLGQALGCGDYGVNGKIERGCEKIKNCLLEILKDESEPNTTIDIDLTFDAYGFSRGAAAARSFTSRIKKAKGDTFKLGKALKEELDQLYKSVLAPTPFKLSSIDKYLTPILSKENRYKICLMDVLNDEQIKLSKDIEVSFLGLYDTVSSYGESFNDDVKELALTIDDSIVKNVYQICAADEYRKNFSLTLVEPFENNVIIPGAHSDIGGGYSDDKKEEYILYKNYYSTLKAMAAVTNPALITAHLESNVYAGNKDRDELKDEGWFTDEDIKKGYREVSNSYSCIALNMMREKSGSSKFQMKDEYNVNDNDLNSFYNQLKAKELYAFEGKKGKRKIKRTVPKISDLEKRIRNKFLHLSSQGESLRMIILSPDSISKPRFVNAAQPGNKRKIIENS